MTNKAGFILHFGLAGAITLTVLLLLASTPIKAVDYATTARGVDVYLVTKSQVVPLNNYLTTDIVITNDGTPLNAMEAEVFFDPTLFSVVEFSFGSALCDERFVIDNVIDNTEGRLHMSCGTTEPFTGNATVFGSITAIPLQTGLTKFTFGESTHVHVHDGLGTEIVRDTYDATLSIQSEA